MKLYLHEKFVTEISNVVTTMYVFTFAVSFITYSSCMMFLLVTFD